MDRCEPATGCVHDPASGYDAVTCHLDGLGVLVGATPREQLGGARAQRRLAAKVGKARSKVESARTGPPAKAFGRLRRANRMLEAFVVAVHRGEQGGKIAPDLGARLVDLAQGAERGLQPLITAATP
jgi:hypothetical protein